MLTAAPYFPYRTIPIMCHHCQESQDTLARELLSNVMYGGSGGVGLVFLFRLGVGSDSVAEFHAQDHVLQAV